LESILPFLCYVCSETHIFSGGGDFACIYQARGSGRIFVFLDVQNSDWIGVFDSLMGVDVSCSLSVL